MNRATSRLLLVGVAIALVIAASSAWLASSHPDGLDSVSQAQGFGEQAKDAPYQVLPDYTVPGVADERLSTVLAGAIGVVVVTAICLGAGALLRRRSPASRA